MFIDNNLFTTVTIIIVTVASSVLSQISEFDPPEDFVYSIHYSGNACMDGSAVSLHAIVTNEIFNVTGPANGSVSGTCSYDTTCLHNADNSLCLEEANYDVKTGQVFKTMNDYGVLVECDTTNDPSVHGACFIFQNCQSSSLYSNCTYITYSSSTLYRQPELIYNPNAISAGLERTTYMVFYNDPSCTEIVALDGIVTGLHEVTIVENLALPYTCADALKCFINPGGDYCMKEIATSNKRILPIYSETRNVGKDVYLCNDDMGTSCELVQNKCMASPVPSCYYRWVSGVELFTNPGIYLAKDDDSNVEQESAARTFFPHRCFGTMKLLSLLAVLWFSMVA